MSDLVSDVTNASSSDEVEQIIEEYVSSHYDPEDIDTEEERDEILTEISEMFSDELSDLEESLASLQEFYLANDLSDEKVAEYEALIASLEKSIDNLEEGESDVETALEEAAQNIYDGTTGGQVDVDVDPEEGEIITSYINLTGSESWMDIGEDEADDDNKDVNGDGFVNADDLWKTTDLEVFVNKQTIALDIHDSLLSVVSWDELSGHLVLKAQNDIGSELIDFTGIDFDKHVIALNGTVMDETNMAHWTDQVPTVIKENTYMAADPDGYNIQDRIGGFAEATTKELLEYAEAYADVTDATNMSSTFSTYSASLTSLTQEQFESVINDVVDSLYAYIANPTEENLTTLQTEALQATSTLNSNAASEAWSLLYLHLLKYEPNLTVLQTIAGGTFATSADYYMQNGVDSDGSPLAIATATRIVVDEKIAVGGLGADGATIQAAYEANIETDAETGEADYDSAIEVYTKLESALNLTQQVYANLGYGGRTDIDESIGLVGDQITALEEAQELKNSQIQFSNGELEALQNNAWSYGQKYGDWKDGIKKDTLSGIMDTFVSNLNTWITNGITADELANEIYKFIDDQDGAHEDDVAGTIICLLGDYAPNILKALMTVENFADRMLGYYRNGGTIPSSAADADQILFEANQWWEANKDIIGAVAVGALVGVGVGAALLAGPIGWGTLLTWQAGAGGATGVAVGATAASE